MRVLIRPEQVTLSDEAPADQPLLGKGQVVESKFAGALRRLRLRVPRLPRTRQIAPQAPYGEGGLLVEAVLPAESPLPGESWVSLSGWRILEQPLPTLLVADPLKGVSPPVAEALPFAEGMGGSLVVLGVVEGAQEPDALREKLKSQFEGEAAEIRVRAGAPAEQVSQRAGGELLRPRRAGRRGPPGDPQSVAPATAAGGLDAAALRRPARVFRARAHLHRGRGTGQGRRPHRRLDRPGRMNARVTLLHVSRDAADPPPWIRAHLDQGVATLSGFDVASTEVRVRTAPSPLEGILLEARQGDYDLVVIGGHGPRSRSVMARDDITLQILNSASRPILVVPEDSG